MLDLTRPGEAPSTATRVHGGIAAQCRCTMHVWLHDIAQCWPVLQGRPGAPGGPAAHARAPFAMLPPAALQHVRAGRLGVMAACMCSVLALPQSMAPVVEAR